MSIEEKLRRGQRLSAQAAALRRAITRDEPPVERSPDARPTLAAVPRGSGARASDRTVAPANGHRQAEKRALGYHRAVVRRLDDGVVADALARLRRWRAEGRIHPRYADEWEALLTGSRTRLRAAITADDEHAAALRQSSPLAGTLGEDERRRALGIA